MTSISDTEPLTHDAFLGGRLTLAQPARGYRAGIDPVLLAASVPARPGQSVLDLGCGVGAALYCLAARVPELDLSGVELQPALAALARRNGAANGIAARIDTADLCALPADLRQRRFDHVIANPPYFDRAAGSAAPDAGREAAQGEATPLARWVATAARRLAPRGRLTMIHRAERLPDLLAQVAAHLGSLRILPLHPRAGRPARLILASGIKGGRAAFRLAPPVTLHEGVQHRDGDSYTPAIRAALRDAAALDWGPEK